MHFDPDLALSSMLTIWKTINVGEMYNPDHRCDPGMCAMREIDYACDVTYKPAGSRVTILDSARTELPNDLTRAGRIPMFYCKLTGNLHVCGCKCDATAWSKNVCPLTGIEFGREVNFVPGASILNVPAELRVTPIWMKTLRLSDRSGVFTACEENRADHYVTSAQAYCTFEKMPGGYRHRDSKAGCFDTAFFCACMMFCDARMISMLCACAVEETIVRRTISKRYENSEDLVKIACVVERSVDSIINQRVPMIVPVRRRVSRAATLSEKCLNFWHVIVNLVDGSKTMPHFFDFCLAYYSLLASGYSSANLVSGNLDEFVPRDHIVSMYPPDDWVLGNLSYRKNVDRSRSALKLAKDFICTIITTRIVIDRCDPSVLYSSISYDDLPGSSFVKIKRLKRR